MIAILPVVRREVVLGQMPDVQHEDLVWTDREYGSVRSAPASAKVQITYLGSQPTTGTRLPSPQMPDPSFQRRSSYIAWDVVPCPKFQINFRERANTSSIHVVDTRRNCVEVFTPTFQCSHCGT
jgi:hypothetical protein